MRFFVFALLAVLVQSIKLTSMESSAPAFPSMVDMLQTTLSIEGCPRKKQFEELLDALRAQANKEEQMNLEQFKEIVWTWIIKHHPKAEKYKD